MSVGQARHQTIRRPLPHVTSAQNDAFRIVVAEAENRIGELVAEACVDAQRREIDWLRDANDRPVTGVDLDVGIAGIDKPRRQIASVHAHLDRRNLPSLASIRIVERDDGMLDRYEVAVPEIAGSAVARLAG